MDQFKTYFIVVDVVVIVVMCPRGTVHIKKSGNNFVESDVSFYLFVGSGDQTRLVRPAWQSPLPAKSPHWP